MVINSILDNDFYKFTMMHAARMEYPDAKVTYQFINRNLSNTFTPEFLDKLKQRIKDLKELKLTDEEYEWACSLEVLPNGFWDYLRTFRYNPNYVDAKLSKEGQLELTISGPWHETILFEVPLLALISETYFEDTPIQVDLEAYQKKSYEKGRKLSENQCDFIEFGTRRRRSYAVQKSTIEAFMELPKESSTYLGTSNVHFSRIFNTKPLGTMAHEWIMAHAGMFGVEGANTKALEVWLEVFGGEHSIALTDTYTTHTFFEEFTEKLAASYSGIRQDSGNPLEFVDHAIQFYEKFKINPKEKHIVFSDSLTVEKVLEIHEHIKGRFNPGYGIGTNLTNDVPESPALNIVIKMSSINKQPVFKLSDTPSKASGATRALR